MERLRRLLFFLALAAGGFDAAAADTPVGGQVVGPDGGGLAGVRVALEPVLPDYERVAMRLGGDAGPGPEAEATTDADGYFQLLAPRLGAWKVVVPWGSSADLTEEHLLYPLSEPTELPAVELRPATTLEIRVLDENGAPADARLGLADGGRPRDGWRARLRLARTGEDGVARLPFGAGEEPRLEVLGPSHPLIIVSGDELTPQDGRVEIRLPAGVAGTVTVTGPRGRRVAGAVAYQGAGILPLGRTGDDGRLRLTVAPPEYQPPTVSFLTADGDRGDLEPGFAPDQANEAAVVLEPLRRVRGRVVDRDSRDPVAGALVWVADGPVTASDARGGYELRLFPSRRLTVQAVAAGYAMAYESKRLEGPDSEDGPTLVLTPAATVRGSVVDADGHPLAGVDVTVETVDDAVAARSLAFRRGPPSTRSTRAGRFHLAGLPPAAGYTLHCRKPGFAPARHRVEALAAFEDRSGVRVVLESGATGAGRVVDDAEAPVAAAEVRLVPVQSGDLRRMYRRVVTSESEEDEQPSARTDGEGRFRLPHLAPGRYDLEVKAAGFAPAGVPGLAIGAEPGETDLGTVVLAPGARLEGVVRDPQGAAVADAEIYLDGRDAPAFRRGGEPAAKSDAVGRFAVADLEAGRRYLLVVTKTGYSSETANAAATEGGTVEVVLRPAGTISGRVRNEDGDAVSEATVYARPASAASRRGFSSLVTTGDQGAFRLENVEPGTVKLTVHAPGYQEYQLRDLEVPASGEVNGLEIVLARGATVVGSVSRRDGTPVVEAMVTCAPAQANAFGDVLASGRTDGEGRFRLDGVAPGPAVVGLQLGHHQVSKTVEIGTGTQTVDLVVDDGFEISGRVVDAAGLPVAGAALTLTATDAGQTRFSTRFDQAAASGSDGGFTLRDVAAGHYLLTASKEGYARASTPEPFEVAGGPVAGVEIELRRGATLRGRILGLEMDDLADVVVRAFGGSLGGSSAGGSGMQQGIVDFEGRYSIPSLGPGLWHVSAQIERSGRLASGQVTVSEAETEVELDLEFKNGFSVDGVVTSAGRPQSGARIFASSMEPGLAGAQAQAVADSEGRFRLSHLPAGKYRLMVMSGISPRSQEIEVPVAGEVVVELGELRIAGNVRGEDGESPIAAAVIRLERLDADPTDPFSGNPGVSDTETDSRGHFSVVAREGTWRLIAAKAGYGPAETTVEVRAGGRYDGLELRLSPTEGVTFEVLTVTGAVPAEVAVAVLDASGRVITRGSVPVGEGGTVRLSTVPAGPWDLVVQTADSAAVWTPIVAPGDLGQIRLPLGGVLRIKVPALAGEPVLSQVGLTGPGGRPHYLLEGGFGTARQWPLWHGETTIPQLAPGVWSFTVTHPDGRTWTGQAVVSAGETSEVVVP